MTALGHASSVGHWKEFPEGPRPWYVGNLSVPSQHSDTVPFHCNHSIHTGWMDGWTNDGQMDRISSRKMK